ncbi:MAG: GspH/FimT family protein [Enterobacterales bacterium]|nr:GspH/FimT family protein [Enterobacterales bacterium]
MLIKKDAFTLIELLISLSIIIILAAIAIPSFDRLVERKSIQAHVENVVKTLSAARLTAVSLNQKVTLCPTDSNNNCSKNWSQGFIAFVDHNGDRQLNDKDEVLINHQFSDRKLTLKWRAFGYKRSLQWLETGITNHQNGTFEFCYGKDPTNGRGIFITKAGRVRYSKDSDGDGIHENATGKPIVCLPTS